MTATYGSILILSASLVILLLLQPNLFNPLTTMPPKPKLNVHNFPRPPLLEKTPRHLQVKWWDQTIADTKDAYWVLETTHPPSISSDSILRNVIRLELLITPQRIIFPVPHSPSLSNPPRTPLSANGKGALHIGTSNPPTTTKRSSRTGHGVMNLLPRGSRRLKDLLAYMRGPGIAMWMGREWSHSRETFMGGGLRVILRGRLRGAQGHGDGEREQSQEHGVGV